MSTCWIRFLLFLLCFPSLNVFAGQCPALSPPSDSRTVWRLTAQQPPRGVAIVVHGLNTNPAKMKSLEDVLLEDDLDVLHVVLSGHSRNLQIFREVTHSIWGGDMLRAYCQARNRADALGKPLYYLGYSLGGMLAVDLLASHKEVHYDKMVLISPALAIRGMNKVIRLLRGLRQWAIIPGLGNRAYMANPIGTPVSAFNALFDGVRIIQKKTTQKANIPTLVLIDPRDELINPTGIESFIQSKKLSKWKIHPVHKRPFSFTSLFHHLIIDPATLGEAHWEEMSSAITAHLK
ncbi:MAG: alpha/beta hydrolase [Bdellovibrio sp.]|nr:alpha/beta hydrolase [Bdellovibrio sp.]